MPKGRRAKHFHLGVRLRTVEQIRGGRTVEECADDLQLDAEVIREWLLRHGDDRPTSVREIMQGSERFVLQRRVEQLRECLARTERQVAMLHKQLVAALA